MKKSVKIVGIIIGLLTFVVCLSSCALFNNYKEDSKISKALEKISEKIENAKELSLEQELEIECYVEGDYTNIHSSVKSYKVDMDDYCYQSTVKTGVFVNNILTTVTQKSGYQNGKMYYSYEDSKGEVGLFSQINENEYKKHKNLFQDKILIDSDNIEIKEFEETSDYVKIKIKVVGENELWKIQKLNFVDIGSMLSATHRVIGATFEIEADGDYNLKSYTVSLDFEKIAETEKDFEPVAVFKSKSIDYSNKLEQSIDFDTYKESADLRAYEIAQNTLYNMIIADSGSFTNRTKTEYKAKYNSSMSDTSYEISFENSENGFSYTAKQTNSSPFPSQTTSKTIIYSDKTESVYSDEGTAETTDYENDSVAISFVNSKIAPVSLALNGLSSFKTSEEDDDVFVLYYDEPQYTIDSPSSVESDYAIIKITIVNSKLTKLEYELSVTMKQNATYKATIVCEYN